MILHYKRVDVVKLLSHTVAAPAHKALWQQKETEKPGLWLVGDSGVYLMSNGNPPLKVPSDMESEAPNFIAYARQCDASPGRDTDDWWNNKRASFGGDDGAEFIPAEDVQQWLDTNQDVEWLEMDLEPGKMSLLVKAGSIYPEMTGKVMEFFTRKGYPQEYQRLIETLMRVKVFDVPILAMGRSDMAVYIGYLREKNNELLTKVNQLETLLKKVDKTPKKIINKVKAKAKTAKRK